MSAVHPGKNSCLSFWRGYSIEYQNFIIQIGAGREGELVVRVLQSPAGQGSAPFQLPWTPEEWLRLRSGLSRGSRHLDAHETSEEASLSPREVGAMLFRALFVGQVGDLFSRSLGLAAGRLRIVLRFQLDEKNPRLALLHSLPWELLYEPDSRYFLGLSRFTPIIRFLDVPRPVSPFPLASPLRVLVAPAALDRQAPLHLGMKRQEILDAWEVNPGVDVVVRDLIGLGALRNILLKDTFHVLHFMGHGKVDPVAGTGVLFFAGQDGARVAVGGETLATLLKDLWSLRLAFLNGCESGRTPEGVEIDALAEVATALVLGGLPAVIGMQFPIVDDAAILFSRTVYDRLAAGDPLDAAVTEGRQALYSARPGTVEWASPAVFTRIADGRLFYSEPMRRPNTTSEPVLPDEILERLQLLRTIRKSATLPDPPISLAPEIQHERADHDRKPVTPTADSHKEQTRTQSPPPPHESGPKRPRVAERRDQVFISYSHKDKVWLERLQGMLKPLVRKGAITLWDDTKITPGKQWRQEIENALKSAKVAILLVSSDFIASDFIHENELPPLLRAAEHEGVVILWLCVRPCLYEEIGLPRYQAVYDPARPLSSLWKKAQWEKVLADLARRVKEVFQSDSYPGE